MMKVKHIVFLAAITILSAACKDEPIEIVTLSKAGETFSFGEKVVVWTGINGNPNKISYDWECTGGRFDGVNTQHLRENLWIAPDKPGEYIVTVTAKTNTTSDSRQTKMKVINYYTEGFDWGSANPGSWSSSNATLGYGNSVIDEADKIAVLQATSSSSEANMRRTLTTIPLIPPFSIKARVLYTAHKSSANGIDLTSNSASFLSIYFVQPKSNLDKPYIREIRLEFNPGVVSPGTLNNWRLRMESFVPSLGRSTWSVTNPEAESLAPGSIYPEAIIGNSEFFKFDTKVNRDFTFTIDKDRKLTIYINGSKFVDQSDAINDYTTRKGLTNLDLQVREFRISAPRNSGSSTQTTWAITDVIINNDQTAIGGDVNNIGFEDLK